MAHSIRPVAPITPTNAGMAQTPATGFRRHMHNPPHQQQQNVMQTAPRLLMYNGYSTVNIQAKRESFEFLIKRVENNDPYWKILDLEEYTYQTPDMVITDQLLYELSVALRNNTVVQALRLPESRGLVTWNALWPLFEAIKENESITRLFISSNGKAFGHNVSVFMTNSILAFFEGNTNIRSLGSFSKSPGMKKFIRASLNRNILHHYVPKKLSAVRALWNCKVMRHTLKGSGSDALSLLFQFDEHLNMAFMFAKNRSLKLPEVLGTNLSNYVNAPILDECTGDDPDVMCEELERIAKKIKVQ